MTAEENSTEGHGTIVALTEEQKQFIAACEAEFADRYTDNDPEFVQYKEKTCTPPIIDPWYNKPRRNFDWAGRGNGGRRHQNWSRNDRGYNQGGSDRGYNQGGSDRGYNQGGSDRGYNQGGSDRGYNQGGSGGAYRQNDRFYGNRHRPY